MDLDSLVKVLERERISLDDIPLEELRLENPKDPLEVKGKIAEKLVEHWLSRCPEINMHPNLPTHPKYRLERTPSGVIVYERRQTRHEYDFLVEYKEEPVLVEVKSLKLNGAGAKIPRAFEIAEEIFERRVGMLLFFPMYTNEVADGERIREKFEMVRCVDLGYKKKQLSRKIGQYFR